MIVLTAVKPFARRILRSPFPGGRRVATRGTQDHEVLLRVQREGDAQRERGLLPFGTGGDHRGVALIRTGLGKPGPVSVSAE